MFTSNAIFVWAVLGLFLGFVVHFIPFGIRPLGWDFIFITGYDRSHGGWRPGLLHARGRDVLEVFRVAHVVSGGKSHC